MDTAHCSNTNASAEAKARSLLSAKVGPRKCT